MRRGRRPHDAVQQGLMTAEKKIIEDAWEKRAALSPSTAPRPVRDAVEHVIAALDEGRLRVAEKTGNEWLTQQWIKKAVLLSFRLEDNRLIEGGATRYYDKVAAKFAAFDEAAFSKGGFRVVPPAMVRRGAYIARNVVLMPSYVNIGAYVVEENSVISMGVFLGQSTRILDRESGTISYGRVPAGSVVVSGSLPSPDRSCGLYCAVIVKKVDAKTRAKTSLNELLRGD